MGHRKLKSYMFYVFCDFFVPLFKLQLKSGLKSEFWHQDPFKSSRQPTNVQGDCDTHDAQYKRKVKIKQTKYLKALHCHKYGLGP